MIITHKIEAIDHVTGDPYLFSLDVRSLHTNIPHKEGIEAVKQRLKKSKPSISIKVILTFLHTNIPHKEGIEAVKQRLKKSKPSISIRVILTY